MTTYSIPTTPTMQFPNGPTSWVWWDDWTRGLQASTTSGASQWFLYESNGADTELVIDDYLRIQTATTNGKVHLAGNRGFKLSSMLAGAVVRFGVRFRAKQLTGITLHLGLGIQDANSYASTAPDDWCCIKATSTALTMVATKNAANSGTPTIATMANDTWYRAGFDFTPTATPSSGVLRAWVNGDDPQLESQITTFPDDVFIFPVIDVNLANSGDYLDIGWIYSSATVSTYVDGTG